MNRRTTALALVAVAGLGLTACTGSPAASPSGSTEASAPAGGSGSGQTVAEACAVVQGSIEDTMAEFESAMSEFSDLSASDPTAAFEAMGTAAEAMNAAGANLGEIGDQVSNTEVAEALPALEDAFVRLGEVFTAVGDGDMTRIAELQTLPVELQESVQRFQELCSA